MFALTHLRRPLRLALSAQLRLPRPRPLPLHASRPFTRSTLPTDDFALTKVSNEQISDHNNLPLRLAITATAAEKLRKLAAADADSADIALRLKVSSGGCHGFQYDLQITNMKDFHPQDGDSLFSREGASVLIDKDALEILRDSKVDYVKELIGEGFKVVESPLTKSSCGCGSSFDVDFDKLQQ